MAVTFFTTDGVTSSYSKVIGIAVSGSTKSERDAFFYANFG